MMTPRGHHRASMGWCIYYTSSWLAGAENNRVTKIFSFIPERCPQFFLLGTESSMLEPLTDRCHRGQDQLRVARRSGCPGAVPSMHSLERLRRYDTSPRTHRSTGTHDEFASILGRKWQDVLDAEPGALGFKWRAFRHRLSCSTSVGLFWRRHTLVAPTSGAGHVPMWPSAGPFSLLSRFAGKSNVPRVDETRLQLLDSLLGRDKFLVTVA